MPFNSPDIETFRYDIDNNIAAILKLRVDSHSTLKIQSLLNITVYALATRFLEGSVKHIVYSCSQIRGDNAAQLTTLDSRLKGFNNPEYEKIKELVQSHMNFDIGQGLLSGRFIQRDISFLNEVVKNRHKNVHASHDPAKWYGANIKDITSDFAKEFGGLINILTYLDDIKWDVAAGCFCD